MNSAPGRLRAGPAPELAQSANKLENAYGPLFFKGMSLGDMAHVIVLIEAGVLSHESGQSLLSALLELDTAQPDEFPFDPSVGDAYQNRERAIIQRAPAVGGWLRAGRARREVTNIAYRLVVRWRLVLLLKALEVLATSIIALAEEHIDTLMPDYTYLQQAQPTTLGHYLLGFVYPMLRDTDRLQACFGRINCCPGGIGSVNGTRLALDRERLAQLLGFEEPIHHTRDAMWQADTPIETTAVAVAILINLDRLAEDLQIWVSQEFNLVELADEYSRSSVIMPQKKNPYSLTYIRGLTNVSIGELVSMANVGRTPSGQPDNRIFAYGQVPTLLDRTREAVELMQGIIQTLSVSRQRMAERAGLGYAQATDLADAIMLSSGLPYETAHRIVGHTVALAVRQGIRADEITVQLVDAAAQDVIGHKLGLAPALLLDAMDLHGIVSTRTGLGGAAVAPMQRMIAECRELLAQAHQWRIEKKRQLAAAEANLMHLARDLADGQPVASE
jgi:argininosuccinate lyase